ncbi:MAG: ATP synthase F1 subunit gamma [Patescibacteria group bacterium]
MAKTKEISRRIKSVTSTKKITKAMEVVAAAKMRKAIEAVLKTRTYANLSWETVLHLAALEASRSESLHPLLKKREKINKVAIILITSNRGMCGGYNTAVINKAKESIAKHPVETDFILVGKKGSVVHRQNYNVAAEFTKSDILTDARDIYPIVKMALSDYAHKKYDKILVAYTDFVNPVKQIPRVKQLVPVEVEKEDGCLGIVGQDPKVGVTTELVGEKSQKHLSADNYSYEYTFEPSPREVLDKMIPRLVEIQLYQAFLEANASEHSASMTAMHQATEAASDMISELTLFYNKARQAGITAEIAEISAGANALAE